MVDLTDGGEELVAEPLAFRGAAHEAGNVDEGEPGRHDLHGLGELRQRIEARIGHRHLAYVRLDGAERIVRRLRRRGRGQRVEERRFADIRQADDAALETHGKARSGHLVAGIEPERIQYGHFENPLLMLHVSAEKKSCGPLPRVKPNPPSRRARY
jgi:hypothetical protein